MSFILFLYVHVIQVFVPFILKDIILLTQVTMYKFIALLQSNNRNELCKLALYYKNATTVRTTVLNNVQW
jgi:hypothetical protein